MRTWPALALVLIVGACSGGGGGGPNSFRAEAACGLLDRLADSAQPVEEVDVGDPARFEEALELSVTNYATTIDDLREVLPSDFDEDLDRLEAAATQYRFEDALTARVALDEYAQANCVEPTVPATESSE